MGLESKFIIILFWESSDHFYYSTLVHCFPFLKINLQIYVYFQKRLEENRWKELESTRERSAGMLQGYSKSASRLANPITAS